MVPAPIVHSKPLTRPKALLVNAEDFAPWTPKELLELSQEEQQLQQQAFSKNAQVAESDDAVVLGAPVCESEQFYPSTGTSAKPDLLAPPMEGYQSGVNTPRSECQDDEAAHAPADVGRERIKAAAVSFLTVVGWICLFGGLAAGSNDFIEPDCDVYRLKHDSIRSCDVCGSGTLLLPIFGEYEKSWAKGSRAALYFAGLLFVFLGMTMICDSFVAAIETITSAEKTVWCELRPGCKTKFRTTVWNPTVANLTLMALGSSAPEILLSITELIGNDFFAGSLGPSTIVGSAAFNLFIISAVCVSAIPAPECRLIEGTAVFLVTSIASLLAYVWLLLILLVFSPNKVDLWEGLVTLGLFPLVVTLAFAADKGWCARSSHESKGDAGTDMKRVRTTLGADLSQNHFLHALALQDLKAKSLKVASSSISRLRAQTKFWLTGSKGKAVAKTASQRAKSRIMSQVGGLMVGFSEERYVVFEDVGVLTLKVVLDRDPEHRFRIRYCTREGTAKAGLRYQHTEGYLFFMPGVKLREIRVPVIDNNEWEPDEEFYVDLEEDSEGGCADGGARKSAPLRITSAPFRVSALLFDSTPSSRSRRSSVCFGNKTATVTVLNDDIPGMLTFDFDEVFVDEGVTVNLGVVRQNGNTGEISVKYRTVDGSATAGKDYTPAEGMLTFASGETHKTIEIPILVSANHDLEDEESFRLELSEPSPGVIFDRTKEGGETKAICEIMISASNTPVPWHVKWCRKFVNRDRWAMVLETWTDQFREAFYCGGTPQDQAEAGFADWFFHVVGLLWKLCFMIVPPPVMGQGWPCFVVSLVMIGATTACAGDVASLLGCCLGIPDEITAITLVALGTSLPDTLASRAAAQQDDTADNAIGNITGSNCVNVFLGLGLAWTMGAVYWKSEGATPKWRAYVHLGQTFEQRFIAEHPEGGFFVPAGATLAFSVGVYTACALLSLSFFYFRRKMYGGELGGPQLSQSVGAVFLSCLWVVYLGCSIIYSMAST